MQKPLLTLDYFKSSLMDAMFELPEILRDSNHTQYQNLQKDLNNIEPEDLKRFVEEHRIDRLIRNSNDIDTTMRGYFLINKIQHDISADRIKILSNPNFVAPYNSPHLSNLTILENNLVFTADFVPLYNGFMFQNFVYQLAPCTEGSNSSYWITEAICELIHKKKINFKIRLDPFIEKHADDYNPMMYKMSIYGTHLEWNKLKKLKVEDYGQWMNERNNDQFTDYVWRPEGDELHFTCEELPAKNQISYRGSRYLHAIFDKHTGNIIHCDGAIRTYDIDEYSKRRNFHVRSAEARKVGKRAKIFQVDEILDKFEFMKLATSFMVWNDDVREYFN